MNQTLSELLSRGLAAGSHSADSAECCAVEAINLAKGRAKSDNTWTVGGFDFRRINDSSLWRDNADRSEGMRGICEAYYDADSWTTERRVAVAGRIALETVRQIISELTGLSDDVRHQCRDASDLKEAAAAAGAEVEWARGGGRVGAEVEWAATETARALGTARRALGTEAAEAAARAAAAWEAEWEAEWAARAAAAAAAAEAWEAASEAAGRVLLIKACAIWVEAARSEL